MALMATPTLLFSVLNHAPVNTHAVLFNTFDLRKDGALDITCIEALIAVLSESSPVTPRNFRNMIYSTNM